MKLTLTGTKKEAGDATTFLFRPQEKIFWQAGQFLRYTLPHTSPDTKGDQRYFTIATAPHEGHVQISTRLTEPSSSFKEALRNLPIGDNIEAGEPEGNFVIEDESAEFLFIAGGIGITPFRAILLDLDHRGKALVGKLLYANRTPDFVFKEELEVLPRKHPGFQIRYVVSPQKIDEALIQKEAPDLARPLFYTSGPEPMVEAFEKMLERMGIPDERSKRDYFPGYDWQ